MKNFFTEQKIQQMKSNWNNSLLVQLEGVLDGWKLCFYTRKIYF